MQYNITRRTLTLAQMVSTDPVFSEFPNFTCVDVCVCVCVCVYVCVHTNFSTVILPVKVQVTTLIVKMKEFQKTGSPYLVQTLVLCHIDAFLTFFSQSVLCHFVPLVVFCTEKGFCFDGVQFINFPILHHYLAVKSKNSLP